MTRAVGTVVLGLVAVWIVARLLAIEPLQQVAEGTMVWGVTVGAASALVAAVSVLVVALVRGRTDPAWLRAVQIARTVVTVVGCALIVVGLVHYRDTAPPGDISVVVLGLLVLVGAALVHTWLVVTARRAR